MESIYFLLKNGDIPLLVYQRVEDKTLYVTIVDPVDPYFSRNDSQLDKKEWRFIPSLTIAVSKFQMS